MTSEGQLGKGCLGDAAGSSWGRVWQHGRKWRRQDAALIFPPSLLSARVVVLLLGAQGMQMWPSVWAQDSFCSPQCPGEPNWECSLGIKCCALSYTPQCCFLRVFTGDKNVLPSGHVVAQGACRAPGGSCSISRNSGKILLHHFEQSQDKSGIPGSLLPVPYSSAELSLFWLFLSSGACLGSLWELWGDAEIHIQKFRGYSGLHIEMITIACLMNYFSGCCSACSSEFVLALFQRLLEMSFAWKCECFQAVESAIRMLQLGIGKLSCLELCGRRNGFLVVWPQWGEEQLGFNKVVKII